MVTLLRVLIFEDPSGCQESVLPHLRREGFELHEERFRSAGGLRDALAAGPWDLLLADYTTAGFDLLAVLALVRAADPYLPVVIIAEAIDAELAVEALRGGTSDFVFRHHLARIGPTVTRMLREATARRSFERETEELAAIVRSTDDAVIGEDRDGVIRSWNPAAEQLYGWTAAEAIGRPISIVVPPDKLDELNGIMDKVRAGEPVNHLETARQRWDGARVEVSLTISPIRDRAGRVIGASKIARDFTAIRKAHAIQARDALILANVRDAVIATDLDGVVTFWNKGAEDMLGWAAEELIGRPMVLRFPEPVRAEQQQFIRQIADGLEWAGEYPDTHKDGRRVWIDVRVRRFCDPTGRPIGILGVSHDITDRKRAEQRVADSEQFLRSALDALSAHVAILAADGTILATNAAWRRFAQENNLAGSSGDIGSNYLAVCDAASGECAEEGPTVAAGIRLVLAGAVPEFALPYPCHSPTEQRWFMLRVTRFDNDDGHRVVVAHENISTVKQGEGALRWQNEGLQILSDAAARLLVAADPVGVVENLFTTVSAHLKSDIFFHFVPDGGGLRLEAAGGIDDNTRRELAWIEFGQPICGTIAESRRPEWFADIGVSDDPRTAGLRKLGLRAYQSHPLVAGDRLLGTLAFGSRSKNRFNDHEIEFVRTLCQYVATAKDRLRAEAEVRRTTDLLKAVTEGSRDAVFVKDLDGRYLLCNSATAGFVGRTVEEVIGRTDFDLFDPDSARLVMELDQQVIANGRAETEEEELTAAGVTRTYSAMKGPYRDGNGRIIGMIGISRDVTERKRIEAERDDALAQLQFQIERMPLAYILYDSDIRYAGWNPAAEQIFGFTRDEILGKSIEVLVHPDDRLHVAAITARLRAGDVTAHSVNRNVTRDGRTITCEWHNTPLFNRAGTFLGVLSMTQDVTARMRAEVALRESEERLRMALAAASMGMFDWDIPSNTILWSDTHYELFGYPPGSDFPVEYRHFAELLHPDDRAFVEWNLKTAMETRTTYACEFRLLLPDGVRWVVGNGDFQYAPDNRPLRMIGTVADVTIRKQAEEQLRASEERFRTLFESMDEAVSIVEMLYDDDHRAVDYRFLEANPTFEKHTGLSDALGRTIRDLVPNQDPRWIGIYGAVADTGEPIRFVDEAKTLDRWYDVYAYRVGGPDSRRVGILSTDITARMRAEAKLRASEERFRAFMDTGPFLAWITAAGGRIDYASAQFLQALRLPADAVEGRTLAEVFPPTVAATYLAKNQEVTATGRVMETTEPGILADGSSSTFLVYRFPVPSPDGRSLVGGVAVDITERVQLQAELVMRDRAIQAVKQGIVITDPNLPDNPIVYASPGFERMTGYSAAEAIGRNCRFLRGKDTDPEEFARLGRAVRERREYAGELLNYRKDGTTFWNELSIVPVRDASGRVVNFIGVQADMTARRSLEDQLRQSQKMEAIGQLAGGVAHDFNNLLTVINGFSEMALGTVSAGHPLRDALAAVREAGERAAGLTQQLLAFSRRAIVAPKVLDLNDVVSSISKLLRRLIGEDVSLAVMLAPTPCRIRIDPGQLEQVIMNLAVNARDAMPKGGRLTIATGARKADPSVPSGPPAWVQLSVRDTGCGMTDEVKTRIFEPFFTTKGVGKGTGLGLAMVYGIVQQASAQIQVESAVGRGTTFVIDFPEVRDQQAVPGADAASRLAARGTETVLLAEDEDAVRNLAKLALEMQGYRVLAARSGEEAKSVAERHEGPIHILVTDVVMPGLGGWDLAEAARSVRPGLPVLFMSGYTGDALVRHGIAESDAFLQKPFTPITLTRKVRELLDAVPRPPG